MTARISRFGVVMAAALAASARGGDSVKNADGDWISASDYPAQLAARPLMLPGGLTEAEFAPAIRLFPSQIALNSGQMSAGPTWSLLVRRGMGPVELGAQITTATNLRPGPLRLDVGFIPDDPWLSLHADVTVSELSMTESPPTNAGFLPGYNVLAMNLGAPMKVMFGREVALQLAPAIGTLFAFGQGAALPAQFLLAAETRFQLNVSPSIAIELAGIPRLAMQSAESFSGRIDASAAVLYTDQVIDLGVSVHSSLMPTFLTYWTVATHVRLRVGL